MFLRSSGRCDIICSLLAHIARPHEARKWSHPHFNNGPRASVIGLSVRCAETPVCRSRMHFKNFGSPCCANDLRPRFEPRMSDYSLGWSASPGTGCSISCAAKRGGIASRFRKLFRRQRNGNRTSNARSHATGSTRSFANWRTRTSPRRDCCNSDTSKIVP